MPCVSNFNAQSNLLGWYIKTEQGQTPNIFTSKTQASPNQISEEASSNSPGRNVSDGKNKGDKTLNCQNYSLFETFNARTLKKE